MADANSKLFVDDRAPSRFAAWSPCNFVQMGSFAKLVQSWCKVGAKLVQSWCKVGAKLVQSWSLLKNARARVRPNLRAVPLPFGPECTTLRDMETKPDDKQTILSFLTGGEHAARPRSTAGRAAHYAALAALFKYAAELPPTQVLETLHRNILSIDKALARHTELPSFPAPEPSRTRPRTLMQQRCDAFAAVYDAAARRPNQARVDAHVAALTDMFERARELWADDDAAARYLDRPSTVSGGDGLLARARRSAHDAEHAAAAVGQACAKMARLDAGADEVRARRPTPTATTVREAASELFGHEAHAFLAQPHPLLGGRTPLDLAEESAEGAARVDRLIQQAQAGTAI